MPRAQYIFLFVTYAGGFVLPLSLLVPAFVSGVLQLWVIAWCGLLMLYVQWRIYGGGGGDILTCPPRRPPEPRRPDPIDALSVQNGVFFAESVLIHEIGTIYLIKRLP